MNLIEAIQSECDRLRTCVKHGEELGPVGAFYVAMAKQEILAGEKAIRCGDAGQMAAALKSMREFKD